VAHRHHVRHQAEYYQRRSIDEAQVLLWIDRTLLETIDAMRGEISRTAWINRVLEAAANEKPKSQKAKNGTT
jgi:hypothetical protein